MATAGNVLTRGSEKMWLIRLLSQRSVQVTLALWVIAYLVVLVVAHGSLPFARHVLENLSFVAQSGAPTVELVVLALMGFDTG